MSDTTLTLTDFLLARIAEDEAAARDTDWLAMRYGVDSWGREKFAARVLAECEAKRRIVELHGSEYNGTCVTCADWEDSGYEGPSQVDYPCPTLRALAAVYADHLDYREEWKS